MNKESFLNACRERHLDVLLESIEYINCQSEDSGHSGLMLASKNDHFDVVSYLIRSGAKLELQDSD